MPDENRPMIELPAGAGGDDVIETGAATTGAFGRAGAALRRRPWASVGAILIAAVLVLAAIQLVRRPQEPTSDAAASPTSRTTTPETIKVIPVAPSPTATSTATITRLAPADRPPVDVVVGDELRTRDGSRFQLGFAGRYPSATVAGGGWLIHGSGTLWYLRSDGAATPLLWQAENVIIGASGDRVAWRKSGRVMTARIVSGALFGTRSSDAAEYFPVWFLGDAIVMALPSGGDSPPTTYSVWRPSSGDFRPKPRDTSAIVLGPNADGTALLGLEAASDGKGCIVELSVEALTVIRRACVLPGIEYTPHTISPNGRWFIIYLNQFGPEARYFQVDLNSAFTAAPKVTEWPGNFDLGGVWISESNYVSGGNGVLKQISMAQPDHIVEIPLTDVPLEDGGDPTYLVPAHVVNR